MNRNLEYFRYLQNHDLDEWKVMSEPVAQKQDIPELSVVLSHYKVHNKME